MFVIIGYIVICGTIFGGYAMGGGHLGGLWQPLELLMIFGGAFGAFVVGNDNKALKATLKSLPTLFKGSKYNKALYMDLLALLFEILSKIRKDGLMSIENDVENPEASPLFSKYPKILHDHHLVKRERAGTFIRYEIADPLVFSLCNLVCGKMAKDAKWAVAVFHPEI